MWAGGCRRAQRSAGAVTAPTVVMDRVDHVSRVETAYRSIHPVLWRALLAYTGDREMASDAESEAFAQVLRRGDDVVDVASWVWRSAFAIAGGLLQRRATARRLGATSTEQSEPDSSMTEFLGLLGSL